MMKLTTAAAIAAIILSTGALAAEDSSAAKKSDALPPQMTIRDCLSVLAGLQQLDGHRVIVAASKPNESIETMPYKFPGRLRDAISHDIFVLGTVQQEAQVADRRIQQEVPQIDPKDADATAKKQQRDAKVADRVDEFVGRSCKVELDKIADADLNLDANEIPGTVLAAIWKIRVK